MNPRFEEKSATECEKQIAGLGKTHQEIIRSLLAAEHTLLKNLYDCMEEDFFRANGGSVKLPKYGTKGARALLAIYVAYKNGVGPFPKSLLDELNGGDNQHLRHIRRKMGIKVVRHGKSAYYLKDLKLGEAFTNRHGGIEAYTFEEIKTAYGYRCATCGAKEGELHHLPQYRESSEPVTLHKGHMNPQERLVVGNIIPQCQFCNRAYRDWVVFDRNGRVIGVSSWEFVLTSIKKKYLRIMEDNHETVQKIIGLLIEQLKGRVLNEDEGGSRENPA